MTDDKTTLPNEHDAIPSNFHKRDKQSELLLLQYKVDDIVTLININDLPKDALDKLIHAVSPHIDTTFDEDFSVREELMIQMQLVKAVRLSILDANGQMKKETTVTEVKSVLDASMRLADMLNKVNKELINQERLQAVEAAFMEVVGDFPKEQQVEFIKDLERRMKTQKALAKK